MTAPATPFKGLASFEDSDLDALFFFGREREREIIAANLMASSLTVLYGETGVGKSSVLRAGVVRDLRALPEALEVIVFDDWKDDPAAALRRQLASSVGAEPATSLAETLEHCSVLASGEIFVILDALEEYFLYHGSGEEADEFLEDFSQAVAWPGLRASFLLSIREDALAKLDRFKGRIPNVLGNYLRLDHLDRAAGREAIVGPVDRYNELSEDATVEIEPALVEAVLDQVAAGRVELGESGRGGVDERVTGGRIEAPFLQLVMARLWEAERAAGSRVLRLATLADLGGAEQIVRDHLDRALGALSPHEQDLAASMFNHLVTPSGTKIAHDAGDLAGYVGADQAEVAPVLASLAGQRILRPVPGVPGSDLPRYEIYHDILAGAVLAWRTRHESDRELEGVREEGAKRHRRLLYIAVGAILLAGAMAGLTIFAFTQRSEADAQASKARARAMDASSQSLVSVDPELSLALAAEASGGDQGKQTEDALRRALLASRMRAKFKADGAVVAARLSPGGSRILVAGGRKASVYDSRTRHLLVEIDNAAPITVAGFGHRGDVFFTGGSDGRVRFWSTDDGRLVRVLRTGAAVRSARLDIRGRRLAVAGGRSVSVWRVVDGRQLMARRFRLAVTGAVMTPDGKTVAAFGKNPGAVLLRVADGAVIRGFDQETLVKDVAFSPNGKLLVTAGEDHWAKLWVVRTGKLVHRLQHDGQVFAVAFGPHGRMVATASADGDGRIWDVRSGTATKLEGHAHFVLAVAFSRNGQYVVTSSSDGTARIWETTGGGFQALLAGHTDSVTGAEFSPDGRHVLTQSKDHTARIWDAVPRPQLRKLATESGPLLQVTRVPRTGMILTAGPGRSALLLRARDGARISRFGMRNDVVGVSASANGRLVAVAAGHIATVFERDTGKPLRTVRQGSKLGAVALSPDGRRLATGGSDGRSRVWKVGDRHASPRILKGHTKAITRIAFSPDGTRLATASRDQTARIWDLENGRMLQVLKDSNDVTSVSFGPDGRQLLTSSKDADARLWSVVTGRRDQTLRWHFGAVADAATSSDGGWIVTAGPVTIQIWQPKVRAPLFPLGIAGTGGIRGVTFASNSHRVIAVTEGGQVLAFDCQICGGIEQLRPLARSRLALTGRKLTRGEREQYGG